MISFWPPNVQNGAKIVLKSYFTWPFVFTRFFSNFYTFINHENIMLNCKVRKIWNQLHKDFGFIMKIVERRGYFDSKSCHFYLKLCNFSKSRSHENQTKTFPYFPRIFQEDANKLLTLFFLHTSLLVSSTGGNEADII